MPFPRLLDCHNVHDSEGSLDDQSGKAFPHGRNFHPRSAGGDLSRGSRRSSLRGHAHRRYQFRRLRQQPGRRDGHRCLDHPRRGKRHQHHRPGRLREIREPPARQRILPELQWRVGRNGAGAPPRSLRRGEPHGVDRARRLVLHGRGRLQERSWPLDDAAVRRADLRRQGRRQESSGVQRLPELLSLGLQARPRHRDQGAADARAVSEPRRAEPRRGERQGSELPRGR